MHANAKLTPAGRRILVERISTGRPEPPRECWRLQPLERMER